MASKQLLLLLLSLAAFLGASLGDGESANGQQQMPPQTVKRKQASNDVDFEMADFEVQHQLNDSFVLLQAYRVRRRNADEPWLQWVTVGYPQLAPNSGGKLLQFDPEGATAFVNLLDDHQRLALLGKARSIYPLDGPIRLDAVIRPLPLSQFSCLAQFFQDAKLFEVHGRVTDFNRLPLKLTFPLPAGTPKRLAFEKRLRQNASLLMTCEVTSTGRQEQTSSLSINSDQLQRLNLSEKLFGPASEVYFSRKQAVELSGEIMSALRIEEYYDSDADQFSESYVQGLVKLAQSTFQPVTFDQALTGLSGYGLSLGQMQIQPNAVKNAFQNEFRILDANNKKLLTVGDGSVRSADPVARAVIGAFNGDQDREFVENKRNAWNVSGLSIDQQLAELNRQPGRSILWVVQNGKVAPKELNVLRLSRNILGQNLKFELIKRKPKDVLFSKSYVLELDGHRLAGSIPDPAPPSDCANHVDASRAQTLIQENVKQEIKKLLTGNLLKHECRRGTVPGYLNRHIQSFAPLDFISFIHGPDPDCDWINLKSISDAHNENVLNLTRHYFCNQRNGSRTSRSQNILLAGNGWSTVISAKGLQLLSMKCQENEYLNEMSFKYQSDNSSTSVSGQYTCCKLALSFNSS